MRCDMNKARSAESGVLCVKISHVIHLKVRARLVHPNGYALFLSGILALGIAFAMVSFQAVKATRLNPADMLRYE